VTVLCKTIMNIFIDWSTTRMSYLHIIPTSKVPIHKLENLKKTTLQQHKHKCDCVVQDFIINMFNY